MKPSTAWLLAAAVAGPAIGIVLARKQAKSRLRRDAKRLFAQAAAAPDQTYHAAQLAGLPAPVQRYFRHVLREGQPYLRGVRLRHGGQFKTGMKNKWQAIAGEEYLTDQPAGFIWQGTTRWFVARDEYVAGRGRLEVRLLGAVPIVQGAGPQYDQGELLRWLAESAWLPTTLLPSAHVAWAALDDQSARLTCTHQGQAVSCLVRFNDRAELAEIEALRYFDGAQLRPWVGCISQYRTWHGVRVPTVAEASWVVDGQRHPYARFVVRELAYEPLGPF